MNRPWLTVTLATALAVMLWGWAGFLALLVFAVLVFAYWTGRHDERRAHQAELDAELQSMLEQHPELDALADRTPF